MHRRKGDLTDKDELNHRTLLTPANRLKSHIQTKLKEIFCVDLRSLALMRIFLGVTVLLDVLDRATDISAHYTDEGVMPRTLLIDQTAHYFSAAFSIHLMSGSFWWMALLFLLTYIFAISLLVGYKTKLSTVVVWLLVSSVQYRNVAVLHSGDDLLRLLLFFSAFVPTEKMFSVDAYLKACERDQKCVSNDEKKKSIKKPLVVFSICALGLLTQILLVYATAFFHKTGVEWRRDRTATWMALQMSSFRLPLGEFLASYPTICKFLTFSVLHWQLVAPWLYLSPVLTGPLKTFVSMGFACMHIGFAFCLRLEMFNWITLTASLTLLPYWFWETIIHCLTRERLVLRYDPKNKFSLYIAHFIDTFFLIPGIVLVRKKEHIPESKIEEGRATPSSSFVIWLEAEEDNEGHRLKNFDAFKKFAMSSLLFWPLTNTSFFRRLKPLFTRLGAISHNTHPTNIIRNGRNHSKPVIEKLLKNIIWWSKQVFILIIIKMIIMWNLRDIHFINGIPDTVKSAVLILQLDQSWRMFSPHPPDNDFWYNIIGETSKGKTVEFFHNGGLYHWQPSEVSWKKPNDLLISYKNHRWTKYFENGLNPGDDNFVGVFGRWVCDQYNQRVRPNNQLKYVTLFIMTEEYDPLKPFAKRPLKKSQFWEQTCFPDE